MVIRKQFSGRVGVGDWDFDPYTGEWVDMPAVDPTAPTFTVTTTAAPPAPSTSTSPAPFLDPNRDDGLPGKSPCNPNGLYPTGHRCAALQAVKDSQAVIRVVQTAAGVKQPAVGVPGSGGAFALPSLNSITSGLNQFAASTTQFVSRNVPAVVITVALLMVLTKAGGGIFPEGGSPAPRRRGGR